jgi:glucose/mannose-6-phosphate isomerase
MLTVLDQIDMIKQIDKSDMLNDLFNTPLHCRDAIKRTKKINLPKYVHPKNIIIIGMGGSAIGGEILKDWLRDELAIPIEVCRDYILPAYVNEKTLVLTNSYSGNTEETLTAFNSALKRKCTVLAVTSGGQLEKLCKEQNVPYVKIPSGLQPRVAVSYMFFSLPVLLEKLGIIANIENELDDAIAVIENVVKDNASFVLFENNNAKQLATKLVNCIPVIYGFRQYTSIAHRIKAQFNENSKLHSKSDVFPELNHNETVGYEAPDALNKKHSVVLIRDPQEPTEIRARIETTTELVFNRAKNVLEIIAKGDSKLAKMLSVMFTGDYVSIYLAILQNIDPTPVKIIEKVKNKLAKKRSNLVT